MKVERLEKEVAELSESSFYLKQEKEENGKVILELVKKIEESVEKENDLLMEIDALVDERANEGGERYKDANSTERLTRREPELGSTGGSEFTTHDWDNHSW